jgi:hypothetical protein
MEFDRALDNGPLERHEQTVERPVPQRSRAVAAHPPARRTVARANDRNELDADRMAAAVMRRLSMATEAPPSLTEGQPSGTASRIRRASFGAVTETPPSLTEGQPSGTASRIRRASVAAAANTPPSLTDGQPLGTGSRIRRASIRLGAEGGVLDGATEADLVHAQRVGRPLDSTVRREFEAGFRADFSRVRVHDDPRAHAVSDTLNAHAFTTGRDIFFARGAYAPETSAGRRLLAHELSHVVQHGGSSPDRAPIKRNYAALPAMGQRRVDQAVEETYHAKALEFETGMARRIEANNIVNSIVDNLVQRVQGIVDAWAQHTGRSRAETYVREFGFPGGEQYYGAFELTANNIANVLQNPATKPLRTKLKLIYNAVRNNNLAKWLKVAAIELDREAKGQAAKNWNIRSKAQYVESRPGQAPRLRIETVDDTVTTGFATDSGLRNMLTTPQQQSIANAATHERQTEMTGPFWATRRDVFDPNRFGSVLGWKPEAVKANQERTSGRNRDLTLDQQRTLTMADVPDLTDEEADLILKLRGNTNPDAGARAAYRGTPANRVPWSQGGEHFDVNLGSDSARAAAEIKARLEAGISGSTDLMLHAAEYLGVTPGSNVAKTLRLGLAGWMIANRDHSFYEVYKAAVPYGLPFTVDPVHPGAEYEVADHLVPMQQADFAGILPNDGPLNNVFPASYFTTPYKDHIANALAAPGDTRAQIVAVLQASGLSSTVLSTMVERDIAAVQELNTVTQAQAINPADSPRVKEFAARRIRLHPCYIYLGNTYGAERATLILDALLRHHHGGAGVARTDARSLLIEAGVSTTILNTVDAVNLGRIEALRQQILAAPAAAAGAAMAGIDVSANAIAGLSAADRDGVKWSLIAKLKPLWAINPGDQALADLAERRSQIEQIAQMVRTTAVWYSWGDVPMLQSYITAPSLREKTKGVPSTQGPGMYIGRDVTTSAGYGDQPGQRCLVIKMAGVPTIDRNNPKQVERLALLQPRSASIDPLEAVYLYDKHVSVEILMIYGGGRFGRLTTNQGVTLTMDLRQAPLDHLQAKYRQAGLWPGASRPNFVAQATTLGMNPNVW